MLPPSVPHAVYQDQCRQALRRLAQEPSAWRQMMAEADVILKLVGCDLDPIRPVLERLYHPDRGRPARDPCAMFRTLLAMNFCQITQFEPWVARLRAQPWWAVVCGFEPDDTPGASTLRDFLRRLTRAWPRRSRRRRPRRHAKQRRSKARRRFDVVWRLYAWLPQRSVREDLLNEILALFAHTSADQGLIDARHLHVAGDSTPLRSYTNPNGRRICSCPPGSRCACRRAFADPDAAWGWDSFQEAWFWGYRVYECTAAGLKHDLPLYLLPVAAGRNDMVSFIPAYLGLRRFYRDWHLEACILDAGHDDEAHYLRLRRDGVLAIIDKGPRGKGEQPPPDPARPPVDTAGRPVCPAGYPMAPNGTSRGRGVWVCPALRVRSGIRCDQPCKGRRVYTTAGTFHRAFPGVLRGSPQWEDLYDKRTAVERSHKRKLRDFGHEFGRTRCAAYRIGLYFFAAYCQHIDAWFAERGEDPVQQLRAFLDAS